MAESSETPKNLVNPDLLKQHLSGFVPGLSGTFQEKRLLQDDQAPSNNTVDATIFSALVQQDNNE